MLESTGFIPPKFSVTQISELLGYHRVPPHLIANPDFCQLITEIIPWVYKRVTSAISDETDKDAFFIGEDNMRELNNIENI